MKYRTIVVDPPWPIGGFPAWFDVDRRSERERLLGSNPTPYRTLSIDAITALPVRDLSDNLADDAHLYLWTVDRFLERAFSVARAWGFHHAATIAWCKSEMGAGLGGVWPGNVEFVLFCRRPKVTPRADVLRLTSYLADVAEARGISRGALDAHMGTRDMGGWWLSRIEHRCACPTDAQWQRIKRFLGLGDEMDALVRQINATKGTQTPRPLARTPGRWFRWPRGRHSQKPEHFYDLVEQVSPPPYLELFARRQRLGWDTWGDEAFKHIDLEVGA